MATAKKSNTQVATAKANLPADINEQMAAELATFQTRLQTHGGDMIKTKDKLFTLPNGDSADELSVIIVDFINRNSYYDKPWNPKVPVPPNCFAISVEATGMIPSPNSPDKQCEDCTSCWANAWNSAPAGSGKACKNERILAVMAPDGESDSPLMLLNVTPTALKRFDNYVASVARSFQRPPRGVITTIAFDPNQTYSSLVFGNPIPCNQAQLAAAWARKEEAMHRLLQEPDVSSFEAAAPVKGKGKGPVSARKAA
jgi:hypothetical protein